MPRASDGHDAVSTEVWRVEVRVVEDVEELSSELQREPFGELRRHFVPGNVGLGISMQKEYRWSVTSVKDRDGRSAGANFSLFESWKKFCRDIL